ncbi:response regulator transcription factor [Chryseolinea lacunae]|uniref:Response regulator transcription factor n=1 Tax=Chryseolinea lacunae TaxID=2801331 RepID=A0ABS1KRH6_9BACT|nr:response regulator transcription factor [Chryseolinea lacunae]MBL0742083.1 response regulator transcription factor [Chryseolinea lacunae]
MSRRILLVEDDENMRFMLQDNLEMAGYSVCAIEDGQTALSTFMKESFDLCVVDVMLPKKDGFTLATDIRRLNVQIPIVFLTAKNLKEDRIHGFKIGADDYITKPFSLEEFLLRIEAIVKRVYNTPTKADEQFSYSLATFTFHFNQQQISNDHAVVELTRKEAKLLRLFCMHQNKVIERDIIQKAIWEDEGYFVGRSMDVFISRLRKIFKDEPAVNIQTIHGVGYKLEVITAPQPTEK